jgi:hypothetical protein
MNAPIPFLVPTDKPRVYQLLVDNSSKELFETCARASQYYSVDRREGVGEKASLFRGGVVHGGLAIRKLCPDEDFESKQVAFVLNEYKDTDFGPDEWRTAEHCIETLRGYNRQWPIKAEPFTVVEQNGRKLVELPFKLLLGHADLYGSKVVTHAGTFDVDMVELYYTGRIDAIVKYGVLLVNDAKTTSVLGQNFYDDFWLSSQMLGYTWAAQKLGYPVEGLFLDVLAGRKPSKTGVMCEFQRQRYHYKPEHLAEWEKDTFTLITDFLEHLVRGYFPKSPKWCFGKYGRCQYWDVCTQVPEQRRTMLMSDLYRNVTWSPLNTNHNIDTYATRPNSKSTGNKGAEEILASI